MTEALAEDPSRVIRLCVDLNVWVRYLLGMRRGVTRPSAAQVIVDAVKTGQSQPGPIQLVVSHAMLSRLEDVLVRLQFQPGDTAAFCSLVGAFSRRGPRGVYPHVVLGSGTAPTAESRMPQYDPYDPGIVPPRADDEDGRVLDTAVAGRADILATYDVADFATPSTDMLEIGRVQVFRAAHHRVIIAHAHRVAQFLRTGQPPLFLP